MTPKEARKRLKTIHRNHLCPVCMFSTAFCQEHSDADRHEAICKIANLSRVIVRKHNLKEQNK